MLYLSIAIGAVVLLLVAVSVLFRTVVPADKVHIVQYTKSSVAYGQNLSAGNVYMDFPSWVPIIGVETRVLPVSNFTISLANYEAYDKGKVPFGVDVKAFFRIANPQVAAQRIESMTDLEEQMGDILKGAIRSILASAEIIEIMEQRNEFGELFSKEVEEQLGQWGVESVKNIELMDIRDSDGTSVISDIMEKKKSAIEKESRIEVAENKKLAEIKEIEAEREAEIARQKALEEVGTRTAQKDKQVGIANELAQQEIKEQAKITAEREMEVKRVEEVKQAEINKDVQVVKAQEEAQASIERAHGDSVSAKTRAEGEKDAQLLKAQGEYEIGSKQAMVIREKEIAKVAGDIELAESIAESQEYMDYLKGIEAIKAGQQIGVEQAKALENADLKLISTGSDASAEGLLGMLDSSTGGRVGGMLSALKESSPELMDKITGLIGNKVATKSDE